WEVRWTNPTLGAQFWVTSLAGAAGSVLMALAAIGGGDWPRLLVAPLPLLAGVAIGYSLREGERRQHTQRLLDLQSEEIIYSNRELEKKFAELETRIEQLSLLTDLSAAVSGTLDPEKIYDEALIRLAHRLGYEAAYLLLVDRERGVLRGHRMAGADAAPVPSHAAERPGAAPAPVPFEAVARPLDADASAAARAVPTGQPILVDDVERPAQPVHLPLARSRHVRSFVTAPLRVREQGFGALTVTSAEPGRF